MIFVFEILISYFQFLDAVNTYWRNNTTKKILKKINKIITKKLEINQHKAASQIKTKNFVQNSYASKAIITKFVVGGLTVNYDFWYLLFILWLNSIRKCTNFFCKPTLFTVMNSFENYINKL